MLELIAKLAELLLGAGRALAKHRDTARKREFGAQLARAYLRLHDVQTNATAIVRGLTSYSEAARDGDLYLLRRERAGLSRLFHRQSADLRRLEETLRDLPPALHVFAPGLAQEIQALLHEKQPIIRFLATSLDSGLFLFSQQEEPQEAASESRRLLEDIAGYSWALSPYNPEPGMGRGEAEAAIAKPRSSSVFVFYATAEDSEELSDLFEYLQRGAAARLEALRDFIEALRSILLEQFELSDILVATEESD